VITVRKLIMTTTQTGFHKRQTIHRVKWRHTYLWSRYGLQVVGHDVILRKVNW